ncbi:class I SAM-dependent methyltransferase [Methylocystis parvus]|uniref:class I SAM-dependent methyltransferase n=1 Tax=Methylocystis parvus TaxID=134 RepID=UPI00030E7647|nr:class I SAM-dependent methyltransferase [Methylocystis parvus]WBK00988.1 class I SAM-dependent methyltransferase [Methylocystis parvus OBBP]
MGYFPPGASTAAPLNLTYRIGKIEALGPVKGRWLDYGCADGSYTSALVERGASRADGVDVVAERIEEARNRFQDSGSLTFQHVPVDHLPFEDDMFDGALVNEVLEHVRDEMTSLAEILRVLRPGGRLIVMSPNRWFPFEGHGGHIGEIQLPWPVPFLPWLPSSVGQRFMHARNYWPGELRDLVEAAGFIIEQADFVWPVLEVHAWLPAGAIKRYQALIPLLERAPFIRRFGVSVFIAARKPL